MSKTIILAQLNSKSSFMKSSKVFRNLLVTGIFLVGGISFSIAQNTITTTHSQDQTTVQQAEGEKTATTFRNGELPADFPKFVDTGNPEVDNANYKAAKDKWISENQELYNAYLKGFHSKNVIQPKGAMATKPSTESNKPENKK